jgi:hypothetical protein
MLRMMILLFATGAVANATTYYVAKTGSDSANGSISTPWLTIGHAASMAAAGDTVIVEDGTYVETVNLNKGGSSEGTRIIFQSQNKWGANIVPTGAQITALSDILVNIGAAYVTFQNFDVSGINQSSSDAATSGIKCQGTANHCNLIGNNLHDMGVNNTRCVAGGAILAGADSNVIRGNYIHSVAPPASAGFRCNQMQAIYVNGGNNGFVQNNIIFQFGQGIAIQFDSGTPNGWSVANNTIFNGGDSGHSSGAGIYFNCHFAGTCDNNNVNNNIIANVQNVCIQQPQDTGTWGANNLFSNNDEFSCGPDLITLSSKHINTLTADPEFVNYTGDSTGDYHLQATSLAIDAGTATAAPATDYAGTGRPQGLAYDIGAYEFVVASAPSPPTGLTATAH